MAAVRRGAWAALRYVTMLFFLGVVVQFFLVGYGLFAMKHGATIDNAKSLDPHRGLGWILSEFGSILLLLLALLAWPGRRLLGAWILLALLAFFSGPPRRGRLSPLGARDASPGECGHPARTLRRSRPLLVEDAQECGGRNRARGRAERLTPEPLTKGLGRFQSPLA